VQNDRRLTQLESKLNGTQRALVWLKRQQGKGNYVQLGRRGLERVPADRFVIDDQDSAFVFDCVGVCNGHALELASCADDVALRALYLVRLLRSKDRPDDSELQRFRSILKDFAMEGLALAGAIRAVSEHHLGGHKVLFCDTEEGLAKRNAVVRRLCDVFNEIAPRYQVEPIAAAELDEAVGVEAPKLEKVLVSLTRAKVDLKFGNGLNMEKWLLPILQPAG
jgi:hypothetical protein